MRDSNDCVLLYCKDLAYIMYSVLRIREYFEVRSK